MRRQVHVRALWDYRKRDAIRARVGRLCHARDFKHNAVARQDLRQRRPVSDHFFFQTDEVCETSYADSKGKYQVQKGIVLPKL